ncbi:hypothetical protein [Ottowia thiooxydans]|uniref:hypothetical protein n=1 Tax=Ottowia thiooxydans TaxID=219182 RepID=UPI0004112194|nr:hypothetical protein [Ottowia thiooxydans]
MTTSNQLKKLLAGLATVAIVGTAVAQGAAPTAPPGGVPASGEQTSRSTYDMGTMGNRSDHMGRSGSVTKGNLPASGEQNARGASGNWDDRSHSMRSGNTGKAPASGEQPLWSLTTNDSHMTKPARKAPL